MSNWFRHNYHLVDESPWPLVSSLGAMFLVSGLLKWFYGGGLTLLLLGLSVILLVMIQWWSDVSGEGALLGLHASVVETGLRSGMVLFIISEVMFFASFFWAYFHSSLAPEVWVGGFWPPQGILTFNPYGVPLLNTVVLLASGVSVTWAHHALMEGKHSEGMMGLGVTIFLGMYFTGLQAMEYFEASFSVADGIYGSVFFVATGFHGLHVIVGTTFLLVCFLRGVGGQYSENHHFGFEAAAWYWHFVDVVWLFLYFSIYWWGGEL